MRFFIGSLLLVTAACASNPPPSSLAPTEMNVAPAAPPIVVVPQQIGEPSTQSAAPSQSTTTVSGTMGGRPFIARSALMLRANERGRACSTALTKTGKCSTVKDGYDISISTIHIYERVATCAEFGDSFRTQEMNTPPTERSIEIELQATWPVPPSVRFTTEYRDPRRDHISATFWRGWTSGAGAKGTSEFSRASMKDGVISFQLVASNPPGSVTGTIPFTVCR